MRKRRGLILFFVMIFFSLPAFLTVNPAGTGAFSGCEEDCQQCHKLGDNEVRLILDKIKASDAKVLKVQMSPVKGLWEVAIENKNQTGLLYVDFSKKFIVNGPIVQVDAALNKTKERLDELARDKKINPSDIPVKNALLMGSRTAKNSVIVFTDPDCPYCAKLHLEMKKVITERTDIAFYLKFLPLKGHKDAYWKSKTILCEKSLRLLEDNFEKKPIPRKECDTQEIDSTLEIAAKLGVTGTPTLVLPDGSVYQGAISADKLISLTDEAVKRKASIKKRTENPKK